MDNYKRSQNSGKKINVPYIFSAYLLLRNNIFIMYFFWVSCCPWIYISESTFLKWKREDVFSLKYHWQFLYNNRLIVFVSERLQEYRGVRPSVRSRFKPLGAILSCWEYNPILLRIQSYPAEIIILSWEYNPILRIQSYLENTILSWEYNPILRIQSYPENTILSWEYNPILRIQSYPENTILSWEYNPILRI